MTLQIEEIIEVVRREIGDVEDADDATRNEGASPGDAEMLRHLDALWSIRDCRLRGKGASHRRWLGVPVRIAKRTFRLLMQPFINEALERQARFNDHTVALLDALRQLRLDDDRREREAAAARKQLADRLGELAARLERRELAGRALLGEVRSIEEELRRRLDGRGLSLAYARFHEEASPEETTRAQYLPYVERYRRCRRVVDLGCGSGIFLELLKEHGIDAYGVDRDPDLVRLARDRGVDAHQSEIVEHLDGLADGALDGVFLGHVVEHFDLSRLLELLDLVRAKLEPGGILVMETPNTQNLVVLGASYFRDPTHALPRHPDTYRFLAESRGFVDAEVIYGLPAPEEFRLRSLPTDREIPEPVVTAVNWNTAKLNEILFGYSNATIACRRGAG